MLMRFSIVYPFVTRNKFHLASHLSALREMYYIGLFIINSLACYIDLLASVPLHNPPSYASQRRGF